MSKLPDPDFVIHEGPTFVWVQRAAMVAILGVVALVVWSILTPVDEVSKARGAVEPIEQVRRVESLHGGRVQTVHAELGQHITAGDLIVSLDQTETFAALSEAEDKLAGLTLEAERLTAFVEDREPDFTEHEEKYTILVDREIATLEAQRAFVESQRKVINQQINEKKAEQKAIESQRPQLLAQIRTADSERQVQEDLVERGLAAKPRLVQLQEQEAQYRFDLAKLSGRYAIIGAEISEMEASILRIDLEEAAKSRNRIVDAITEKRALESQMENFRSRLAETEIRAPISGIIQSLPDETTGDVVDPGGVVATLVPAEGGVRFKGRLTPRDIAFVEAGQPVRLKIDSFNFSRYGALEGTIENVSPTTSVDARGNAYYEVQVELAQTFFRDEDDGLIVLPGMTGEADILTGSKTVFEYIWKPIYTNLDLALSER